LAFGLFSKRVRVELIDDATGETIARVRMTLDELPDSFLEHTTLEAGGASWSVSSADPPMKRRIAETMRLKVRLRPIETIDPGELLYSLPTISDDIAPSDGAMADGSETSLREDDWRQIECVSRALETEIDAELADIQAVHENAREGIGFRAIHVRRRIPEPLGAAAIGLADLERRFGRPSSDLRLHDSGRRIDGGLCYDLGGGWTLYGLAGADGVAVLAVAPAGGAPAPSPVEALAALCRDHGLLLVDWCRCLKAEPGSAAFPAVFSHGSSA